jgi:putative MATE family efflux protein
MTRTSPIINPAADEEDSDTLVKGSLWKAIWNMSWPLLLTTTSSSIVGLVDVQVSGRLGSAAQAAVGVSEQITFLFIIFIIATGTGTTALVSRAAGADDHKEVANSTGQSIALALMMGCLLATISLFVIEPSVRSVTDAPDVVRLSASYMKVFCWILIPFSIINIINAAYRAIGDAKTPLLIMTVNMILNIVGDYAFVVYQFPIKGLGVSGIALSSLFASLVSAGIAIFTLLRSPLKKSVQHIYPLQKQAALRLMNIGVPTAFQRFGWAFSVFVVFFILRQCPNPTPAIASWTVGMRVESLIFMPLMALSMAVASIVGQSLGAKDYDRAFKAGWQVSSIGVGMMLLMASTMFICANPLAHWMSQDPATIMYTKQYLRINAVTEPFLAVGMVLTGALQGAGDAKTPMWITLFTNWIIRLPLAWFFAVSLNWGPAGVWTAMASSILLSATLTTWRFQSKKWMKIKV